MGRGAVIGVTFGVGQNHVVAFHLEVEQHLLDTHHLLMQGELDKQVLASNEQELVIFQTLLETRVDAVLTRYAGNLWHIVALDAVGGKVHLEVFITVDDVLDIGETGELEVGGAENLFETGSPHHAHAGGRFLLTFGAIVHTGQQMTMHIVS